VRKSRIYYLIGHPTTAIPARRDEPVISRCLKRPRSGQGSIQEIEQPNRLFSMKKENPTMMRATAVGSVVALLASALWAGAAPRPKEQANSPEALRTEIESLKAGKVAWRAIAWKSCLLEGLRESRQKNKPVLLWVFIDRPIDDARC
jgi:hypothetical protein